MTILTRAELWDKNESKLGVTLKRFESLIVN